MTSSFCSSVPVLPRRPRHQRVCRLQTPNRFSPSRHAVILANFDPYQELDIPNTANDATIKRAYRRAALERHPDVSREPDARERFQRAQDAYRMLSDPKSRAAYDRAARRSRSPTSVGSSIFDDDGGASAREYARNWRKENPMPEDLNDDLGSVLRDLFDGAVRGATEKGPSVLNDVMDFLERGVGISNDNSYRTDSDGGVRTEMNSDERDEILRSKSEDVLEAEIRECDRAERAVSVQMAGMEEDIRKLTTRSGEWKRRASNSERGGDYAARDGARAMVEEIEQQRRRMERRSRALLKTGEATRAYRKRVSTRLEEVRKGGTSEVYSARRGREERKGTGGDGGGDGSSRSRSSRGKEEVEDELNRMKRELGL